MKRGWHHVVLKGKKNVETDDSGNRQITITNFSFIFFYFIVVDLFDKHASRFLTNWLSVRDYTHIFLPSDYDWYIWLVYSTWSLGLRGWLVLVWIRGHALFHRLANNCPILLVGQSQTCITYLAIIILLLQHILLDFIYYFYLSLIVIIIILSGKKVTNKILYISNFLINKRYQL